MSKPIRGISLSIIIIFISLVTIIAYTNVVRGQQFDRYKNEIERLEAELTQTNLSADDRKSGERKLQIAIDDATRMAGVYLYWTQVASGLVTLVPTTKYIPATENPESVRKAQDGIDDHPMILRPIPGGHDLNSESIISINRGEVR